jgi:2-polyprenyl-3-methyl-5-hydroxy-6-metoxy-1,4-benzoquinol methylase
MNWTIGNRTFGPVEKRPCPVCNELRQQEVIRRPDGLPVMRCICGLRYVNPQPTLEALRSFYASGYFAGGHDFFQGHDYFDERDRSIGSGNVTGWSDLKALGVEGRSVLDLGCASGALLVLARNHGARRVKGIELDEAIAERGRRRYGLEIEVGDVLQVLARQTERFDLVAAFDLLEHVKDPVGLLRAISGVLEAGGRFVCSVPNGACLELWKLGWVGASENMEHLCYFRTADLERISRLADLRLESIAHRGFPLRLRKYGSSAGGKTRALREPAKALSNGWAKLRVSLFGRGQGHELAATFVKPA